MRCLFLREHHQFAAGLAKSMGTVMSTSRISVNVPSESLELIPERSGAVTQRAYEGSFCKSTISEKIPKSTRWPSKISYPDRIETGSIQFFRVNIFSLSTIRDR